MTVSWEDLRRAFPKEQITQVNKGFGPIDTINHAVVTDRLINVTDDWTYSIDETFEHKGQFWIRGTLTIGGVSRPEYGEGADPKKALSDFLKRAAMRFGVALELWAKAPLDDTEVVSIVEVKGKKVRRETPPSRAEAGGANADAPPATQSDGPAGKAGTERHQAPVGEGSEPVSAGDGGEAVSGGAGDELDTSKDAADLLIAAVKKHGTLARVVSKAHALDPSVRTEADLLGWHLIELTEGKS